MLFLLKEVEVRLIKIGSFITVEDLNKVGAVMQGIDTPYKKDMNTQDLLDILKKMNKLIIPPLKY